MTSRGRSISVLTLLTCFLVVACGDEPQVTRPATIGTTDMARASTVDVRAAAASRSLSWVGDIHREAMEDLIANMGSWRASGTSELEKDCAAVFGLMLKYMPRIETMAGMTRSNEARVAVAKSAMAAVPRCKSFQHDASIFPFEGGSAALFSNAPPMTDTLVTEDVLPYLSDMDYAVSATNGSNAAVASAVNGVLSSAGSLSEGNYSALVAAADFTIDSFEEWNAYDWVGETGSAYCDSERPGCEVLHFESIFMPYSWLPKWLVVGDSDLIGCMSGMGSTIWAAAGGPVFLAAIAGQCGIWGIGASAGAFLSVQ